MNEHVCPEHLYSAITVIIPSPSLNTTSLPLSSPLPTSQGGVGAILELLNWSWSHLTRNAYDGAASELQHFAFIAKAALGLLKTYIQRAYPIKGLSSNASLDSTELSAVVNEAKCLLKLILSSHEPALSADGTSPVQSIVSICQEAFLACFDAFYPSLPLKWYALCEELQSVDPVSVKYPVCTIPKSFINAHKILLTFILNVRMTCLLECQERTFCLHCWRHCQVHLSATLAWGLTLI